MTYTHTHAHKHMHTFTHTHTTTEATYDATAVDRHALEPEGSGESGSVATIPDLVAGGGAGTSNGTAERNKMATVASQVSEVGVMRVCAAWCMRM